VVFVSARHERALCLSEPAGFTGVTRFGIVHGFAAFGVLPEKVAIWQGSKNQEEKRDFPVVQRRTAVGVFLLYPYLWAKRLAARQVWGHCFQKDWERGRAQQGEKSIQRSISLQYKKQPSFF